MKFKETKEVLNQLTADLSQASAAIHQIHWFMRGKNFKHYHELMDDYRAQIEDQLDEVAERLIIIDGTPVSTLEEFAEKTRIESVPGDWDKTIDEHLERLIGIFRTLADGYQKGIEAAGEEGDAITEDIFIAAKADIELNIWMLQAERGQAPEIDA